MGDLWVCFEGSKGRVALPADRVEWITDEAGTVRVKLIDVRQQWAAKPGGIELLDAYDMQTYIN